MENANMTNVAGKPWCVEPKCNHPGYTHHVGGCTARVRQGACYVPCKCQKTKADVLAAGATR